MTSAAGIAAIDDNAYYMDNCKKIIENREYTSRELRRLGFTVLDSMTNFVFAKHPRVSGEEIYKGLRERGILVRHFSAPRICEYNRITVGSLDEMRALVAAVKEILEENK
jgi:histidinol-phosphate aminotransferase